MADSRMEGRGWVELMISDHTTYYTDQNKEKTNMKLILLDILALVWILMCHDFKILSTLKEILVRER